MKKDAAYLLAFIAVIFIGVANLAIAIYQSIPKKVSNHATIRVIGVDIFADENLTEILLLIEWGMLDSGENRSYQAWIQNTGNDPQKLVMWTETWNPVNASDWISLTWNYDGSWIPVNASLPVAFTLHVDSNVQGITDFSFDIWVKGVH